MYCGYLSVTIMVSMCQVSTIKFTYLLTYLIVQSPSWEDNWFTASQEIPRISRNPKVHYRTHKRPPPVSILGQPNPVHIPTSHLLEIHLNIIHPSTPRSPQWPPSLRFPQQDPIHPLLLTHTFNNQILYVIHTPTNALFIRLVKSFKFTLKYTIISRLHVSGFNDHHQRVLSVPT